MLEYQNKKNNFSKGYVPKWSEEVLVIEKIKNTTPWSCYQ